MARKALDKKTRDLVLARDRYACRRCLIGQADAELNINHIVPVSQDGSDEPDNLSTLCRMCHREWEVVEPWAVDKKVAAYAQFLLTPPLRLMYQAYHDENLRGLNMVVLGALMSNWVRAGKMKAFDAHLNRKPSKLGIQRKDSQRARGFFNAAPEMRTLEFRLPQDDPAWAWAVSLHKDGKSCKAIAELLNQVDERTDTGKPFTAASVGRLVKKYPHLYNPYGDKRARSVIPFQE